MALIMLVSMRRLKFPVLLFVSAVCHAQTPGSAIDIERTARGLLGQMTLEEKAALCSGRDLWTTKPLERLKIPSIWLTDGPSGLRKSTLSNVFEPYIPATNFPSGSCLGASWNVELAKEEGKAIGEECQANQVQVILSPGINMKRSPLCGRNFEYYSEDPVLAGEMAAAYVNGVQSKGVGACVKHFAVNNQEYQRDSMSSVIDDRTLREIYLRAFEIVVRKAQPWVVMSSYNQVNGIFSSQNPYLLSDILRKEWGYQGITLSDWWSVHDRVAGIRARLDLEMPGGDSIASAHDSSIVDAVKKGTLALSELDLVVTDLLKTILKANTLRQANATYDKERHHLLARRIASESIVLLKNEDHILPLAGSGDDQLVFNKTGNISGYKTIAIIGAYARKDTLVNGGGSAGLLASKVDNPFDEISKLAGQGVQLSYADGYRVKDASKVDEKSIGQSERVQSGSEQSLIDQAVNNARRAGVAIIFAGVGVGGDREGRDRANIDLPAAQQRLIEAVAAVQKNTIVVLNNGSVIAMPWLHRVKGVLLNGLNGQAAGGAIADVLFGIANPSGRLTETYPMRLEDNPSYLNFPGENFQTRYGEGIFIGYRYYEAKKIRPLFPFGFGLSYTQFAYSDLKLSSSRIGDNDSVTLTLKIRNTGSRAGKEVVQIYVGDSLPILPRPLKELKAFAKIALMAGEEKDVSFILGSRDFAFYNPAVKDWMVHAGDYTIMAGASSEDIRLIKRIEITASGLALKEQ